jgi:ribosome maturation factor RimP
MDSKVNEEIMEAISEVCRTFGVALYDVEYDMRSLRIYIDALSPEERITVETCAKVSEALSLRLDLLDLIDHSYVLEVSSPGVERKLKRPEHFKGVVGKNISLVFQKEGVSSFTVGKLLFADDEKIIVETKKGERLEIPYSEIKSANLKVSSEELFGRGER